MSAALMTILKKCEEVKRSIQCKLLALSSVAHENMDVSWDRLPYNCLVKICMFLQDRDRYRMACVCRSWHTASQDPSLWRSHVFFLYCSQETPQAVAWLRSRAKHIRRATIMCFGTFDQSREQFLKALQQANLTELDINGAAYWRTSSTGASVSGRFVARIVRLVKTQRRLVRFQMRQAMLEFNSGMGVLNAIAVSSGNTIEKLGLEDFFGDDIVLHVPAMPQKFSRCIAKFLYLNELTLNYEYLTDHLLYHLSNNGQTKTLHLNVVMWLTSRRTMLVTREGWAAVVYAPRDVRVYLILQNIRNVRDVIRKILLSNIPMYRLDLVGIAASGDDDTWEMLNLLQHVGDCYKNTLVGFRLWSDNYVTEATENAILNLLRRCPKLTYLDLHLDLRAQIIEILCGLQMNKVIQLETLRLARSLAEFAEFQRYRQEVWKWYPVLKDLGLDFHVRAESAPSHSARNEYVFIIADTAGVMDSENESYLNDVHGNQHEQGGGSNTDGALRDRLRSRRRAARYNPYYNSNNSSNSEDADDDDDGDDDEEEEDDGDDDDEEDDDDDDEEHESHVQMMSLTKTIELAAAAEKKERGCVD